MTYDLAESVGMLAEMIHSDPLMGLINAVIWLDPLWFQDDDGEVDGEDLEYAFHILRTIMPELYVDALTKLHEGADNAEIENFICGAITRRGIPVDYIEEMRHGIPLNPIGINLGDIETYDTHPELAPFIENFGVELDEGVAVIPDGLHTTARTVSQNLMDQPYPEWKKVEHLLDWVFSVSGNSLIDYNLEELEEMSGCEPLWWSEQNIDLAIGMYEEADLWGKDSREALKWLEQNPEMMSALIANMEIVAEQVNAYTGKERFDGSGIHLEWPDPDTSLGGETLPRAELLQLRNDAA